MNIHPSIEKLLYYAQSHLLLDDLDVIYARNKLIEELRLTDYVCYEIDCDEIDDMTVPDSILDSIAAYALESGIISEDTREKFLDRLMDIVMMRPSEVSDIFDDLYAKSPQKAFDFLYDYNIKSNYIKLSNLQKNKHWEAKGTRGKLEVNINLARPEKNNKETAKMLEVKSKSYPSCNICRDNEGFSGNGMYRRTLRTISLNLGGEDWFWQFSPFSYFNQHGIAVNNEHIPMKIDLNTLNKLFDFVEFIPTYFIGCNAALPRVGGSILTHDHFQGGKSNMPMFKAPILKKQKSLEFPYITIERLDWYNSALRFSYTNKEKLAEFVDFFRKAWESYSDDEVDIFAKTGDEQHNAITPIARKLSDGRFCMDVILRNNRTSKDYPEGIFHSHPEFFPVKSESIGLIEAMGTFILPGRLANQMERIEKFLTKEVRFNAAKLDEDLVPFVHIIEKLVKEAGSAKLSPVEAQLNVKDEINRICEGILYNTAVFKNDDLGRKAFDRFLNSIGISG